MKRILVIFVMIAVVGMIPAIGATRLSILRTAGSVTHQWEYMPSDEVVTQQGLKNKVYPIKKIPTETYLQSEYIDVAGCDLGLSVRYYVATKSTHSIKIELVDELNEVVYSFENSKPQLNTSTMTIGEALSIGVLEDVKKVKIRLSLSKAYDEDEAINVDELELYSNNEVGLENIVTQSYKVGVTPHAVIIDSDKNGIVDVYAIDGTHLIKEAICIGANRIELSSGIYVLTLDGRTYKVMVP